VVGGVGAKVRIPAADMPERSHSPRCRVAKQKHRVPTRLIAQVLHTVHRAPAIRQGIVRELVQSAAHRGQIRVFLELSLHFRHEVAVDGDVRVDPYEYIASGMVQGAITSGCQAEVVCQVEYLKSILRRNARTAVMTAIIHKQELFGHPALTTQRLQDRRQCLLVIVTRNVG
jgi:hypothetical protein